MLRRFLQNTRGVRDAPENRHVSSRPLLFQVAKGKILAGKLKELGYAGEWERMLEALEEGPKNAIVCT